MANWKKHRGKAGTNGFRFDDDCEWGKYNEFGSYQGKPGEKCKECHQFVTRIDITGKVRESQICVGDKKCHEQVRAESRKADKKNKSTKGSGSAAPDPGAPRVAWHGEFFREQFLKGKIPEIMTSMPFDDLIMLRIVLAGILDNNGQAQENFRSRYKIKSEWPRMKPIWKKISQMDLHEIGEEIRQAAIAMVLWQNFGAEMRYHVACHIGILLSRDWRLHREYLEKKTTKELLHLGEVLGVFKDEKALKYLYEVLLKKRKRFDTCKKEELIKVFLDSGVDLAGKVPDEILVDKVMKREAQPAGAGDSESFVNKCNLDRDENGVCIYVYSRRKIGDCIAELSCCRECSIECDRRCDDALLSEEAQQ
jgi:hypothetical protein